MTAAVDPRAHRLFGGLVAVRDDPDLLRAAIAALPVADLCLLVTYGIEHERAAALTPTGEHHG